MLSFLESRFLSAIEWFVPRSRAALDADGLRRSRLTIGAVGAVLVCTLLTGAWLLVSVPDRKPYPLLFLAFGATCVPFVLRQTGSLRVTGHTIGAVFSIALASMIWRNGAETYPPFAVLPVIPMVTMLIAGTGAGVFWAVVSLAQVGLFFALHQRGLRPFEPLEATFVDQGRFVGTALMVLFVLLFTYLYERLKNRALEDLVAERQRQVELRDRFLSHVSHELRTPVAAADQFVGLVADEVSGEINHEQREFLEGALRNTKHLVAMIDDLVAVSRVRFREMNLELADLSVGQLLRNETSRWSTMGAEHGVSVRLVVGDDLPLVRAQSTAVCEVVERLLDNAIRFSPEGGQVRIEATPTPEGGVRVAVSDEGPGVEPERMHVIFEGLSPGSGPEWRSRRGLGVGLTIARGFVHAMGGRMQVRRPSRGGSEFEFTLPGAHAAAR